MSKLTKRDAELLEKMRKDPPGTKRTAEERIAFEHWWDDQVDSAMTMIKQGATDLGFVEDLEHLIALKIVSLGLKEGSSAD